MFKSNKLSKIKIIQHGFFNKIGGKSTGIYKSLNCGIGSKDKKDNVKKNLEIVRKKIGNNSKKIFLLHQFHSNKIIYLNNRKLLNRTRPKADAIITDQTKIPIGILTADCAPILLCDKKRKMIAAIHAGWKGVYKDILDRVIRFMINKGCKHCNITAAIGPCISVKNYEVKNDFQKKFLKKNKQNQKFFKKKNSKIYFDLTKYIYFKLKNNKIKFIDSLNIDTYDNKNNFYSSRRAMKLNENDYGRNISIIMIK